MKFKYSFLYWKPLFDIPNCKSCEKPLKKDTYISGKEFTSYICLNDICAFSREYDE